MIFTSSFQSSVLGVYAGVVVGNTKGAAGRGQAVTAAGCRQEQEARRQPHSRGPGSRERGGSFVRCHLTQKVERLLSRGWDFLGYSRISGFSYLS